MYLIEPIKNGERVYDHGLIMAIQDYFRNHFSLDEEILFPSLSKPTVQIGKFQNAYEEVNQAYMDEHNIQLVRRNIGGGAIYVDDRNMNFSLIQRAEENIYGNYQRLFEPVIAALNKLGVEGVEQRGRNDLVLHNKKIGGSAMTVKDGWVYSGYTLLLDPDYKTLGSVLTPNEKKIQSHAIQSVRSRVGAIRPYLSEEYKNMTVWEFADYMICEFLNIENKSQAKRYELTKEDWDQIENIAQKTYNNWDWNYGRFQEFTYELTKRFPSVGTITVGLDIEHAKIAKIKITGDFFSVRDIEPIEEALIGIRLRKADIVEALQSFSLKDYFGDIDVERFAEFLLNH